MDPSQSDPTISTSLINNANNATIQGGHFTVAGVVNNNANQVSLASGSYSPIDLLLTYCALDALVNANERYDPPKCAPHTRDAIINEIVAWANGADQAPSVLWLSGSAGAGKSAVCQTVAERFLLRKMLLGSFFFSRAAGASGRSNGDRLIPTLIYQLFQALPETRQQIKEAIRSDPAVLKKTRHFQMITLFMKPLAAFSWRKLVRNLARKQVRLIVIDGLDECQDAEVQCDILRILATAAQEHALPLRILVASRPEAHIRQTFDHPRHFEGVNVRRINLDEDVSAPMAIMQFLRDGFKEIHETHPLRDNLDSSWPSEGVMELLTTKSSPQFVYASTVIKYVQSTKHLPSVRLDAILTMADSSQRDMEDRPLDDLDKLYRFIFSGVNEKHRADVWCLLGIIHLAGKNDFAAPPPTPSFLDEMLKLYPGGVRIALEPLFSVLAVPNEQQSPIKSLHASLFDFLLDHHRSGPLALDLSSSHLLLLQFYTSKDLTEEPHSQLRKILHHAKWIDPTPKSNKSVDRILVALFGMALWGHSDPDMAGRFAVVDEAFSILSKFLSVQDGHTPTWLSERLQFYRESIPQFTRPSEYPFTSNFLQTKHCVFLKITQEFYPPGCNKTSFLTTFNESAFGYQSAALVPYLHLAVAFAADSRIAEWLDFIYSVGFLLYGKKLGSDQDVEVVLGCKQFILKALNQTDVEKPEKHMKAIQVWLGVKVEAWQICDAEEESWVPTVAPKPGRRVKKTTRFVDDMKNDIG